MQWAVRHPDAHQVQWDCGQDQEDHRVDVSLTDYRGRDVRLTAERWAHILDHPEMVGQRERLVETLAAPDLVIGTVLDPTVLAYHRLYATTPVSRKYLVVIVKATSQDAFVLTYYYTTRPKRGRVVWHP
jgi:hypothetical protein